MVLELPDQRQKGRQPHRQRRAHLGVPPARLRRRLPLLRLRPHVPRRALRPRPLGRCLRALRRQVRRAHLQASRGLHALAQRTRPTAPGAGPGTPWISAPSAICSLDLMRSRPPQGPPHGHLLFALRVVQPALALRQATLRRRAHVPAVQGRRHPAQAEHHLLRRRVGPGQRRVALARAAGLAVQRIAREGRSGRSTTAGAKTPATSTAATTPPNTPRACKQAAHPWEESRGMGFSYGYNRMETARRLPHRPRAAPHAASTS